MLRYPLLLTASLLSSASQASELAYAGIWQGTVGERPALVCFEPYGSSFYDQQTLHGLRLSEASSQVYAGADGQPEMVSAWQVGGWNSPQGSWIIDSADAQQISGRWRSADGSSAQAIQLSPLGGAPLEGSCSHPDNAVASPHSAFLRYNGARIAADQRQQQPASYNGHDYHQLNSLGGSAPQLPDEAPGAAGVNAFVEAWLQTQTANAWDCEMGARSLTGQQAAAPEWQRSLTPILWNPHWLVLEDNLPATFCGGVHDTYARDWQVFELGSGQKVDVLDWLHTTGTGFERQLSSALQQQIAERQQASAEAECGPEYRISAYPQTTGMAFHLEYPHVMMGCNSEVVIPWAEMTPHLTAAGQQAAQSLRAE